MTYSEIFSAQHKHKVSEGNILIINSVAGNTPNILSALEQASSQVMQSVAFLGIDEGKAASLANKTVIMLSDEYGPIEDIHMIFDHLITGYFQQPLE